MTILGIDISHYQPPGDWTKVPGIVFSAAKATQGTTFKDPTYLAHTRGAKSAGLVPGAYHWLEPGSNGAAQCEFFLKGIGDPTGFLIQLDCEESGITYAEIVQFVHRWNVLTDNHPIFVYSGQPFWYHLGNHDLRSLGPWWLAAYPGGVGYPGDKSSQWGEIAGGVKPTIWQWGPIRLPGFPKGVDGNAFRGTRDQLMAFTGAASSAGPSQPIGGSPVRLWDPLPGLPASLDYKTDNPNYAYLVLTDGTIHGIGAKGFHVPIATPARLREPLPKDPTKPTADRATGWVWVGTGNPAFSLASDVVATPLVNAPTQPPIVTPAPKVKNVVVTFEDGSSQTTE